MHTADRHKILHRTAKIDNGDSSRKENRSDVAESLLLHTPFDGLDHLPLYVFGIDEAVWPDVVREPDREPPAR